MSYYSFLHKSVKWWRKVFFWCIEAAVVNSFVIYKSQAWSRGEIAITHSAYRRQLVDTLSGPIRSSSVSRRRTGPRLSQQLERLKPVRHFPEKATKRRDCIVCSKRSAGERHTTLYYCNTCSNKPYLCPSTCFHRYHTQKNFK